MKQVVKRVAGSVLSESWLRAIQAARASRRTDRARALRELETQSTVESLLASGRPIWLEIGAGGRRLEGWTSMDWNAGNDLRGDLTKPLPFPDNSVERIYSSHTFEHFSYPHPMLDVLHECKRVLKPGGWIKICVPDASIYLRGYTAGAFDTNSWCVVKRAVDGLSHIDCANYMAYMDGEHRHMFDAENLVAVLRRGGFPDAAIREFDPEIDMPQRKFESLYAGGTKPVA